MRIPVARDFNYIPGLSKAFPYTVITPPATTPISRSQLKGYLKLDETDTSEDELLDLIIDLVTEVGQCMTKRDFINRTNRTFRDVFPSLRSQGFLIRRSKLQSVNSIEFLLNTVFTVFPLANTGFTIDNDYSTIFLKSDQDWPTDVDEEPQAVKIEFVSGYGPAATDVPAKIRGALLQHAAAFYSNRGDCSDSACGDVLPVQAALVYRQHRIIDVAITQTIG